MKKATATAPANIAFIKYWGKTDDALRLPTNDSVSMNLSGATTVTTVEFDGNLAGDDIADTAGEFSGTEKKKISVHLDRVRSLAGTDCRAKVRTRNSFPKGAGSASSASGFAALTFAACRAAELNISEREMTVLARMGSGSACRSIPDGFVEWKSGTSSESSYAESLYTGGYWELCDVLAIVSSDAKKTSSTTGMENVRTSPFWDARLASVPGRIRRVKQAFASRDFPLLGETIEAEMYNMHALMMTQDPPLLYWSGATVELLRFVSHMRTCGIPVWATVDAGPNVHCICEASSMEKVAGEIGKLPYVQTVLENRAATGAHASPDHLF